MNFVDIPKTISDELCNTGGGFHEQGRESVGEAFFIDIYACSGTNDLRAPMAYILIIVYFVLCVSLHFVESGAFRFHVTKLRIRTIKHKSLLSKRLYKNSQSL